MDVSKVTIAQMFEKPRRYLVPLCQRRYVWSEQEQWQPLWEDIVAQADAVGAARSARKPGPLLRLFVHRVSWRPDRP